MKKGISQIVAVVLMVTVSVIAGVGLYYWSRDMTTPKGNIKKPVSVSIRPISTLKGTFLVTNVGTEQITLTSLDTDDSEVVCDFVGSVTIPPQGSARCYMPPKRGVITVYGTTTDGRSIVAVSLALGTGDVPDFSFFNISSNLTYTVNYDDGLVWVALKENSTTVVNETVNNCNTFYTNTYTNYSATNTYTVYYKGCDGVINSKAYST